jgi:hypothetical protein
VAVAQLGEWLHHGMDYAELDGADGEVQVFTDYRRRGSAAQAARRAVLAGPAGRLRPADQRPLIWQGGTVIRSQGPTEPGKRWRQI